MRTMVIGSAVAMIAAMPAAAQQQAAPGVDAYLCQFAGKCGSEPDATPTKAAPSTKGFRLAAPQSTAAPATKGFRLAQPSAPAKAPAMRAVHRAPVAVAHAKPAAGTRADLMLAFGYNSDRTTPSAQGKAKVFAQALMTPELKDKRFLIEGHTDSRGSRDLNVDLSRRRAQSVADYLVAQGVEAGRVEVKGVGPDAPLPGRAATAEANRRVEAVLLS